MVRAVGKSKPKYCRLSIDSSTSGTSTRCVQLSERDEVKDAEDTVPPLLAVLDDRVRGDAPVRRSEPETFLLLLVTTSRYPSSSKKVVMLRERTRFAAVCSEAISIGGRNLRSFANGVSLAERRRVFMIVSWKVDEDEAQVVECNLWPRVESGILLLWSGA